MSSAVWDIRRRLALAPQGWRSALTAISLLWFATVVGAGMSFLTQALLAREMGPASFGLFTSSLATVTIISPLAGFGLSRFMLQVYGAEGWAAQRWLPALVRSVLVTTSLAVASVALWAFVGASADARGMLLLLLPIIPCVLVVSLMSSKLRLEERYKALAWWQLTTPGSRLLVAILLLLVPTLADRFVAAGYGLISVGLVAFGAPELLAMLRGGMRLKGHGERAVAGNRAMEVPRSSQLWTQAWAYGMEAVLYPIFFQISTVLLKYLDGNVQAGIFSIGLGVMMATYLLPATIYQKFLLSKLHRWAVHDTHKFWMVYHRGNALMLVAGLLLGAVIALLSPWFVPLAFGQKYDPVIPVLRVLALCVPLRFLSSGIAGALLNEQHMRYRVFVMGFSALAVVLLNVVLIPAHHAMGAAVAITIGEALLLAGTYAGVRRFHGGPLTRS
jgi:O-antigen/teichoic acid export membrane protein